MRQFSKEHAPSVVLGTLRALLQSIVTRNQKFLLRLSQRGRCMASLTVPPCPAPPMRGEGRATGPPAGWTAASARDAKLVEQAIKLVERRKGDGHFTLLPLLAALLDADLHVGSEQVRELFLEPRDVS